jgi:hypothetical protein
MKYACGAFDSTRVFQDFGEKKGKYDNFRIPPFSRRASNDD